MHLAVGRPRHQGVGLGRRLLDRAIEDMRSFDGIDRLELTVLATNTHARRMYERAGFVEEGVKRRSLRQPNGRYEDEVIMALWVGES